MSDAQQRLAMRRVRTRAIAPPSRARRGARRRPHGPTARRSRPGRARPRSAAGTAPVSPPAPAARFELGDGGAARSAMRESPWMRAAVNRRRQLHDDVLASCRRAPARDRLGERGVGASGRHHRPRQRGPRHRVAVRRVLLLVGSDARRAPAVRRRRPCRRRAPRAPAPTRLSAAVSFSPSFVRTSSDSSQPLSRQRGVALQQRDVSELEQRIARRRGRYPACAESRALRRSVCTAFGSSPCSTSSSPMLKSEIATLAGSAMSRRIASASSLASRARASCPCIFSATAALLRARARPRRSPISRWMPAASS